MNDNFDQLSKTIAQGTNRRRALIRFGLGLAGLAFASLGLTNKADAGAKLCQSQGDCSKMERCCSGTCVPLSDNNNCGACGIVCAPGRTCKSAMASLGGRKGHAYYCA